MTTETGASMREARRQRLVRRLAPDRANAIAWALVLAWGAVVLLLDINGVSYGNGWDGGAVFGVGAGAADRMDHGAGACKSRQVGSKHVAELARVRSPGPRRVAAGGWMRW